MANSCTGIRRELADFVRPVNRMSLKVNLGYIKSRGNLKIHE